MFANNILPDKILSRLNEEFIFLQDEDINAKVATQIFTILSSRKDYFLELSNNVLGKEGGITIAKLSASGLGLAKSFITNDVVKLILTNQNLKCLNLRGNEITDEAFMDVDLARLANLEALDLSQTRITHATCEVLAKLPNLKILVIDYNDKLSRESMMMLMAVPSLCYLQAEGCDLDDATKKIVKKFNVKNQARTAEALVKQPIVALSSADIVVGKPGQNKTNSGCGIQ